MKYKIQDALEEEASQRRRSKNNKLEKKKGTINDGVVVLPSRGSSGDHGLFARGDGGQRKVS